MNVYAAIDTNVIVSAMISSHDDAATVQVVGKLFTGEIIPQKSYILVDDIITQGGTIASLIEFTTRSGGEVRAVLSLAYAKYSTPLAPAGENIERLRSRYGDGLPDFFEECGLSRDSVKSLTNSEVMYLLKFSNVDNIRKKLWSIK